MAQSGYETGLKKFGAMLGDEVEVGCGSVLNPGTVIGPHSNIYPLSSVREVVPAQFNLQKARRSSRKTLMETSDKEGIGKWQKATHTTQAVFPYWKDWRRSASVPECTLEVCPRKGLNHLIYEIVDNAVDEHLAGYCTKIEVISGEGRLLQLLRITAAVSRLDMHEKGMSAERLVFTTLHAGGKFDDSAYKTSGGLHGVGSSVVNALSTYLDVQIMQGRLDPS